ncbi:MAG: hypothetical protein V3U85_00260, partial [Hyphomicrobium sp.]
FEEQASVMTMRAQMHQGARDAVAAIGKNIQGIMPQAEKEVAADERLDDETKVIALRHVARALTRVSTSLSEFKKNQHNSIIDSNGQAAMATRLAQSARAKAELELAKAQRREEVDAEQRASMSSEAPASDEEVADGGH